MISFVSQFGKKYDDFAVVLAEEFMSTFPVKTERNLSREKQNRKLNKAIDKTYNIARTYRKEVKLGIYGKAKIGNKFMWTLKEHGYDDTVVENITNGLLQVLSEKD